MECVTGGLARGELKGVGSISEWYFTDSLKSHLQIQVNISLCLHGVFPSPQCCTEFGCWNQSEKGEAAGFEPASSANVYANSNVKLLQTFPLFIYWVPCSKVELCISKTQPFLYPRSKPEEDF